MATARMTAAMRRSLENRLQDLEERIALIDAQDEGDENVDVTALVIQMTRERDQIADALRDVQLIDDEPFDFDAIEVGDLVTIRDDQGRTDSYVLVDGVGARAGSDWVSVGSPLGAAILGRSEGDTVEVVTPHGRLAYAIVGFERASGASLQTATSEGAERRTG